MKWLHTIHNNSRSLGLDISDYSIEIVDISFGKDAFRLREARRIVLPANTVYKGRIKNDKLLKSALREILDIGGPKDISDRTVQFGLSEQVTYVHVAEIDKHTQRDISEAVSEVVESNIPLAKEELVYVHAVDQEFEDVARVLIIATSRVVLDEWKYFFEKMNLKNVSIVPEIQALKTGIFGRVTNEPTMLIDMGSSTTNILAFDEKGILFSYPIYAGGVAIVRDISRVKQIDESSAFSILQKIDMKAGDNGVVDILRAYIGEISREVIDAEKVVAKMTGTGIQKFTITGGLALTQGLAEGLSENLGKPVGVAAIAKTGAIIEAPSLKSSAEYYFGAIGLALSREDSQTLFFTQESRIISMDALRNAFRQYWKWGAVALAIIALGIIGLLMFS